MYNSTFKIMDFRKKFDNGEITLVYTKLFVSLIRGRPIWATIQVRDIAGLIAPIGCSNGCMVEKFYLGKNGMKWAKNEHDMSYIRSYIVVRVGPQRVTTSKL